jgi:radical SAM superfamily enzyme YgiQ (UPF0313 family)
LVFKKADILLVVAPPFLVRMPHIGIAYLARYLRAQGFDPAVCDLSIELHNNANPESRRFWQADSLNTYFCTEIAEMIYRNFRREINKFVDDFLASDIKVIGFTVNIINIFLINRIAKMIKDRDPSRFVILGGPATFFHHPRDLIAPCHADLCVIGEGETVLTNILLSLRAGRKIKRAPGILLGRDLGRRQPAPAPVIADLDAIPFPDYKEFDLSRYNLDTGYQPIPILMSRGCVRRCAYCIDHLMWPKYRFRSPAHIMEEIVYHIKNNKTRAFEMVDLCCNGNLKQLEQLSDMIIESGLEFPWVSYAIIRDGMTAELLAKIRRSGCSTLIYGVENGSDRILRLMGKSYTSAKASEVIRMTHEAGIKVNVNLILGFPGETEDDFNRTLEFVNLNKDYIQEVTNVSACTLFPEADLGRNKWKYGVCFRKGTDPMLFTDANGVDRLERHERVTRMVEQISALGLSKVLVNKAALNPQVKMILENEKNI